MIRSIRDPWTISSIRDPFEQHWIRQIRDPWAIRDPFDPRR
jgi:hypothetical protein